MGTWSSAGCSDCLDECAGVPNRVACEAGCDDAYTSCLGGMIVEPAKASADPSSSELQ